MLYPIELRVHFTVFTSHLTLFSVPEMRATPVATAESETTRPRKRRRLPILISHFSRQSTRRRRCVLANFSSSNSLAFNYIDGRRDPLCALPHVPDAWIDHEKTKIGYEIPFNRHFYVFKPPRELDAIDAELEVVTGRIVKMIGELSQ